MKTKKEKDQLKGLTIDFLREVLVYDPEAGTVRWHDERPADHFQKSSACKMWHTRYAGLELKNAMSNGYRYVDIYVEGVKNRIYQHVVAFALTHGFVPECVDFKDGDPSNIKIDNLRAADLSLVQGNRRGTGKLARGVYVKTTSGYGAECAGKKLGTFDTEEEAAEAYLVAAEEYFGEFAYHLSREPKNEI